MPLKWQGGSTEYFTMRQLEAMTYSHRDSMAGRITGKPLTVTTDRLPYCTKCGAFLAGGMVLRGVYDKDVCIDCEETEPKRRTPDREGR